jgi:hypothetical protein
MVNYRLDADEGILLQTSDVMRYDGDDEFEVQELCLTNKNLIFVYDSNTAVFSKENIVVDRIPLDRIKYINGVVQVKSVNDDDYGRTLQILYTNGKRELIELGGPPKKVYPQWQDAISNAVVSYIESNRPAPAAVAAASPVQEAPPIPHVTPVQPTSNATTTGAETKKVVYCSVCGEKNNVGARFCQGCGATIGAVPKQEEAPAPKKPAEPAPKVEQRSTYTERKQEYAGRIIKCPACGAELPSFAAICPDCGHEINSQNVSPYIREFSKSIDEIDQVIANDPEPPKTGWKTWTKGKKIFWVILNLFTSCIPLVIYLTWPLVKPFLLPNKAPVLSSAEKRKAALIENFTFPNEREATIEAMMFTKSKMAFIASERFNKKTLYWLNLWNTKAEQLNQRANIILKGDKVVEATYADIVASKNKVQKTIRIRAIIGAVIIVAFLVFVGIYGSLFNGIGSLMGNGNGPVNGPISSGNKTVPTISADAGTNESEGIYSYQIRNYVGKNVASIGSTSGNYVVDEYGAGDLRLTFVTKDGMIISPADEAAKQYTVVGQNLAAGTNLVMVHLRDSKGEPYSNLVAYQSYDELVLYVAPIGDSSYQPTYTAPLPTLDRHKYHVREYVGRNAASFGEYSGDKRIDEYGAGELRIVFTAEDGSFVDASDINSLKCYIVISQDIAPNTELQLNYETDSKGQEYDNLIKSQNYEEINLTVRRLDDDVISKMPTLENTGSASGTTNYVELTVKYTVLSNGKAEITGFSGDGNHATIDSKIDGHEVVGIAASAFKDCTTLESVLFWAEIEYIGDYAFAGCTALTSISIPTETTSIGAHAFEGCTNLSSLIIWGSPNIGENAFAGCTSITSVSIDSDTEEIGAHAFDGCANLESVIIWGDDTVVGKDAFANCPKLKDRPIQE